MIKNYLFLAKSKIFRNKKYFILNLILMIVILFTLMINVSMTEFINEFAEANYNQNYHFKKLFVSYDPEKYSEKRVIEIISSIPTVELVSPQEEFFTSVSADIEATGEYLYEIYLTSCTPNSAPRTFNGNTITANGIIIPDNFKPNGYSENLNGQEFIGKQIRIKYKIMDYTPITTGNNTDYGGTVIETKEAAFNVIGTYDNDEYFEFDDSCYILNDDMSMLFSENIEDTSGDQLSSVVAICDCYKNVNNVITELREYNLYAMRAANINTKILTLVIIFGYLITIIFMLISIFTTWSSINMDFHKNKTEYALLKCMGYKDKELFTFMLTEHIIISVISLIFSYFISMFALYNMKRYIIDSFDSIGSCELTVTLISLVAGVVISLILPLFVLLLNSAKLCKISPIEADK